MPRPAPVCKDMPSDAKGNRKAQRPIRYLEEEEERRQECNAHCYTGVARVITDVAMTLVQEVSEERRSGSRVILLQ